MDRLLPAFLRHLVERYLTLIQVVQIRLVRLVVNVAEIDPSVVTADYVQDSLVRIYLVNSECEIRVFLTVEKGAQSIWVLVPKDSSYSNSIGEVCFVSFLIVDAPICVYDSDRRAVNGEIQARERRST